MFLALGTTQLLQQPEQYHMKTWVFYSAQCWWNYWECFARPLLYNTCDRLSFCGSFRLLPTKYKCCDKICRLPHICRFLLQTCPNENARLCLIFCTLTQSTICWQRIIILCLLKLSYALVLQRSMQFEMNVKYSLKIGGLVLCWCTQLVEHVMQFATKMWQLFVWIYFGQICFFSQMD
jgi:hypothetical protein